MAKALTAAAVDKCKADPDRRLEIPDGLMTGLYLQVHPSGAKSWAVRYRYGGAPRKLTLGRYPALELSDAREAAGEALRAVAKGKDPAKDKVAAKATVREEVETGRNRFDNVARAFLNRHAKPKNRSWRETARLLGLIPDKSNPNTVDDPLAFVAASEGLSKKWGNRQVSEISKPDVLDVLDSIADRGSPIAANRTLAALRRLFNWCVERGLLTSSPCAGLKSPAPESSRDRVLSDDEIRWLWTAAEAVGFPFGTAVKTLLLTAQRREEVTGISRQELHGAVWTIPAERAKNGKLHAVPLPDEVIALFEAAPRKAGTKGLIFTTVGDAPVSGWSRGKRSLGREMLAAARKEAEQNGRDPSQVSIPHWTLHDLRRTAASGMARLGVAVHVVERLLNHRTGTISGVAAVYNRHEYWDERTAAIAAWAAFVRHLRLAGGTDGASN